VQCTRTVMLSLSVASTNYFRDEHSNVLRHVSAGVALRHCSVGDEGDENVCFSHEMVLRVRQLHGPLAEPKHSRSSASTTQTSSTLSSSAPRPLTAECSSTTEREPWSFRCPGDCWSFWRANRLHAPHSAPGAVNRSGHGS
jgi:hypothetical protein